MVSIQSLQAYIEKHLMNICVSFWWNLRKRLVISVYQKDIRGKKIVMCKIQHIHDGETTLK